MSDITITVDDTVEIDTVIQQSSIAGDSVSYDTSKFNTSKIEKHTMVFNPTESGTFDINVNGQVLTVEVKDIGDLPEIPLTKDVSNNTNVAYGITFNDDGTQLHIADESTGDGDIWTLSSPYDITTASYLKSISGTGGNQVGYYWGDNGNKLYTGSNGGSVYSYTASEPYDLTSLGSPTSVSPSHSHDIEGLFWKPDGSKLYLAGVTGSGSAISEHSASTPWDITTLSKNHQLNEWATNGDRDLVIDNSGTRILVVSSSGYIYKGTLSTSWDLSTTSSASQKTKPIPDDSKGSDYVGGIKFGRPDREEVVVSNRHRRRVEYLDVSTL